MRQKGRFAGFSIYLSNSTRREDWILCYKDGPELPPLDFNTTCIKYGRYVIYYNERLKGVTYPDAYESVVYTTLCEVLVHGCTKSGVYGVNCDKVCPINCQEQRCNVVNGSCLGCRPGWTGDKCDQSCPTGRYGIGCNRKCVGHCTNKVTCNREFGHCVNGCASGWMGDMCDKACQLGYFGRNCSGVCSKRCISTCNFTDGSCDCAPGWRESNCSEECIPGTFGVSCQHRCSGNCIANETCSRFDGSCPKGCKPPYGGLTCDHNALMGSLSVDYKKDYNGITIGLSVSLTVNFIACAVIIFLLSGRILQNIRTKNKAHSCKNAAQSTEGIGGVLEEKNNYQEILVCADNNEYQMIQASEDIVTEQGSTYLNLAFSTL
ncbi:multiple epidermal growth factor-like domains protein 11 [Saccostrea cucullata]|uniref:multiple epidermal growth factor-like domains protein 11 n=1 Tax=Saccostrea cuccullata TaxID=36930 RepID=UPI002ED1CA08